MSTSHSLFTLLLAAAVSAAGCSASDSGGVIECADAPVTDMVGSTGTYYAGYGDTIPTSISVDGADARNQAQATPTVVGVTLVQRGALQTGMAQGSYSVDPSPSNCGVCGTLLMQTGDGQLRWMYATRGQLQLDHADARPNGRMSGRLLNAEMREIDPATSEPMVTGCITRVRNFAFDVQLSGSTTGNTR